MQTGQHAVGLPSGCGSAPTAQCCGAMVQRVSVPPFGGSRYTIAVTVTNTLTLAHARHLTMWSSWCSSSTLASVPAVTAVPLFWCEGVLAKLPDLIEEPPLEVVGKEPPILCENLLQQG